eukprot:SAG31_NODE_3712_length_3957_cov_9.372041_3_plen_153_part_00
MYTAAFDNATGEYYRAAPGDSLTAAQIRRRFPGFGTELLRQAGPWFTGAYETRDEAAARAARVARLLQSPELRTEMANGLVVLVVHGDIINHLMQKLLGDEQIMAQFPMPNSGTALLEVRPPPAATTVRWFGRVGHLGSSQEAASAMLLATD